METTNSVQRLFAGGRASVHVGNNYNTFHADGDDKRSRILQHLYQADASGTKHANNYESHKERNPKPEDGTCRWFFTSEQYLEWLQSPRSTFLWLTSDAGCGKSVLASMAVDVLRKTNPSSAVCHFFFRDDSSVQADGIFALRALLYQLLLATDPLPPKIAAEYDTKGELAFYDLHNLWKTFISTVGEDRGTVFCVLDGLDECEAKSQRKIASYLAELYELDTASKNFQRPGNGPYLKVFLTARPLNGITSGLSKLDYCRMRGGDHAASIGSDIELVITKSLGEMVDDGFIEPQTMDHLYKKLLTQHDDTFLWAALILDQLKECSTNGASEVELINVLNDDTIYALYAKFLDQCAQRPGDMELRKSFLQILLAADHPLTLDEMDYAVSMRAEHKCLADLNPYLHNDKEKFFKRLGGSLVTLRGQVVRFIHQSAREFLLYTPDGVSTNRPATFGSWYRCLHMEEAHETLALRCVWYLLLRDFGEIELPAIELQKDDHDPTVNSLIRNHPFLHYASNYWLLHSRGQGGRALAEHKSTLLCPQDRRFRTWLYVTMNIRSSYTVLQAVMDELGKTENGILYDPWTYWQLKRFNNQAIRAHKAEIASMGKQIYDMGKQIYDIHSRVSLLESRSARIGSIIIDYWSNVPG